MDEGKETRKTEVGIYDHKIVAEKELAKAGAAGYQVVGISDGGVIVSKQVGVHRCTVPVTCNEEEGDDE